MTQTYKATLLILDEDGRAAVQRSPRGWSLPEVDVQPGRVGIMLSRAVREQLHLDIFSLVLPRAAETPLQVLRLHRPEEGLSEGLVWGDTDGLAGEEYKSVLPSLDLTNAEFGGYAWYSQVTLWIQDRVRNLGYSVHGFEQWNGRIGGVLLRVFTDGPTFWFKAVADFNAREFWISKLLAGRHPQYFPCVVASEARWNAFLLQHIDGKELHSIEDLHTWKKVARLLAEIQVDWMGDSEILLTSGAADLRPSALVEKLPAFLEHIAATMGRQGTMAPAILSTADLSLLEQRSEVLCLEAADLPFAEGLANADFSPHNVLISQHAPIFIDWAEACVSLPLIAGEYLWNRMAVEAPERKSWQGILRETYFESWAAPYGNSAVQEGARLLPAFAVLAVAMFYHERECHGPSPYDSYLRSLARLLHRQLRQLQVASSVMYA
jgi:hypothetical protein